MMIFLLMSHDLRDLKKKYCLDNCCQKPQLLKSIQPSKPKTKPRHATPSQSSSSKVMRRALFMKQNLMLGLVGLFKVQFFTTILGSIWGKNYIVNVLVLFCKLSILSSTQELYKWLWLQAKASLVATRRHATKFQL